MKSYNFDQYMNKRFTLHYIVGSNGQQLLQPVLDDGTYFGRPIILNSERHRFLMAALPDRFPPTTPNVFLPFQFTEAVEEMNVYSGYNVSYYLLHQGKPPDEMTYLNALGDFIFPILQNFIQSSDKPTRFQLYLRVKYVKYDLQTEEWQEAEVPIHTRVEVANTHNLSEEILNACMALHVLVDRTIQLGSGWIFNDVVLARINYSSL